MTNRRDFLVALSAGLAGGVVALGLGAATTNAGAADRLAANGNRAYRCLYNIGLVGVCFDNQVEIRNLDKQKTSCTLFSLELALDRREEFRP